MIMITFNLMKTVLTTSFLIFILSSCGIRIPTELNWPLPPEIFAERCDNDPLSYMEIASPGASGKTGGLFGCVRWGPKNCSEGNKTKNHKGIDLLAPIGTSIYAMYGGTVTQARDEFENGDCDYGSKSHGNRVIIKSNIKGQNYWFFYCHMSDVFVRNGQFISKGSKIGLSGTTGNACDIDHPHVHLEIQQYLANGETLYLYPENFLSTQFDNSGNTIKSCP